jgi:hypothetical protein
MPVAPPYQQAPSSRGGLSVLKGIGYFALGTFWIVVDGMPVAPVGLLGLLGLVKERRKLAMALIVLAGCVLGGIGTGISVRYWTNPPFIEFHVGIGLHPTFSKMVFQRQFRRIGLLDEGKALADKALEAIKAGDQKVFRECFDPIAFKAAEDVEQFFALFEEKVGSIESFRNIDAGTTWSPELKKNIYVLWHEVETSKAGAVRTQITLHKTAEGWRLLGIHL